MRNTVPLIVLALAKVRPSTRELLAAHACVRVGKRVEVDVQRAEELCPGIGVVLDEYWRSARQMLADLQQGQPHPDAVMIRHVLSESRQVDTKASRTDLGEELFALSGHPRLAMATHLLEAHPNWADLRSIGRLKRDESTSQLTVTLPAQGLPEQLGGARGRHEVIRSVTLEANHAAWRDRKTRRLVAVTVTADEAWPRPATA